MSAAEDTLSRDDVETLCLLHEIVQGHDSVSTLTARFGLAPELESAIERALEPSVTGGRIAKLGDRWAVTEPGRAWMEGVVRRLAPQP